MSQRTFASQAEFEKYGRKSRRELFLDEWSWLFHGLSF
jgi:IS5 family transposase